MKENMTVKYLVDFFTFGTTEINYLSFFSLLSNKCFHENLLVNLGFNIHLISIQTIGIWNFRGDNLLGFVHSGWFPSLFLRFKQKILEEDYGYNGKNRSDTVRSVY